MALNPLNLAQALLPPPLDVLVEVELTSGFQSGAVSFTDQPGFGIVVRFAPVPIEWGYHLGRPNVYEPALAQISFSSNQRVYAVYDVRWGDWLLYPTPNGPWLSGVPWQHTDLEVYFAPGISGRVWILRLPFP